MPTKDDAGSKPPGASDLRWSVERRLAFIEQRLLWEGRINRADLVVRFGISPNQATADLGRFEAGRPGALVYDPRSRTYRAGAALRPPDDDDVAGLLREFRLIAEGVLDPGDGLVAPPPLAIAEAPLRRVDPAVLAAVLGALRERTRLSVVYRSFSGPEPRRRLLEPHALIFDGFRWHTRAADGETDAFKDFVLGRLSDPHPVGAATLDPATDTNWTDRVTLVIAPHPGLTIHQRKAIAIDYGMRNDRLELGCRKALVWYLRRRLGLVPGHEAMAATDQHIVLLEERAV